MPTFPTSSHTFRLGTSRSSTSRLPPHHHTAPAKLLMPTLGFLKKIRTKDSSGSKDLNSPTSPVGISPVVSSTSGNYQPLTPSASHSSYTSFQTHQSENTSAHHAPSSHGPTHQAVPTSTPNDAGISQPASQSTQPSTVDTESSTQTPQTEGSGQSEMEARSNGASSKDRQATGNSGGASTPTTAVRTTKGKYSLTDFIVQRTLGTGSFGRVHLVQSKHNQRFYAVKVLKKQQVVKMKQVEHTNDERRMLQKVKHPFLVTLWGTFQDSKNLYMVMDFVEGGELFSLLRKSQVSDITFTYHLNSIIYGSTWTHWKKSGFQIP